MHLLPQSFVFQATYSSSQRAPDGTAALLLPAVVQFFEKACRTSSRGRLFRFDTSQEFRQSKQTALFHQLFVGERGDEETEAGASPLQCW